MKIFKEIGLILLGSLIMFSVFAAWHFNQRLTGLEKAVPQIVDFINKNVEMKQAPVMPEKK